MNIANTYPKFVTLACAALTVCGLTACSRDDGNDPFLVPKTAAVTTVSSPAPAQALEQGVFAASLDSAARMLGAYAGGMKDIAVRKLDDAAITDSIRTSMTEDPALKDARISIDTHSGVVTLEGRLAAESARERAMQIARAVSGVTYVNNRLIVEGTARNPVYRVTIVADTMRA